MGYVPERGDVVWIHLNPQAGHEQAGHRPALVLSPQAFNKKLNVMFCCPITSRKKRFEFEIPLPDDADVKGGDSLTSFEIAGLASAQRKVYDQDSPICGR